LKIRGQLVNIYGFSYPERHVKESKVQSYPVAEERHALHIGMLHGSVAGNDTHAVYAPFTKEEVLSKGYDYWALGHIHKRQLLHENPPIVYSGNIQSRHRNEQGVKGFYDVHLSKGYAKLDFVPTSAVVYENLTIDCTQFLHANELLNTCVEKIKDCREQLGAIVVDITLLSKDEDSKTLLESASLEEWLEVIREMEATSQPFTWVQSLKVETYSSAQYVPTAVTESVLAVLDCWGEHEWKNVLKELYQNTLGSRFLEPLTLREIEQLKEDARQLFTNEMTMK